MPGFLQNNLDRANVGRLHAFGAACCNIFNLLAFSQGFEAVTLDFLEMRKQIFTTISRRNEAEAFSFVEPFNRAVRTCTHKSFSKTNRYGQPAHGGQAIKFWFEGNLLPDEWQRKTTLLTRLDAIAVAKMGMIAVNVNLYFHFPREISVIGAPAQTRPGLLTTQ